MDDTLDYDGELYNRHARTVCAVEKSMNQYVGKSLESEAIRIAVRNALKALEIEFPPPGKCNVTSTKTITKNDSSERKLPKIFEVQQRIRKDLDKYSEIGEIKKNLYSMPDYVRSRNQKGVKFPEIKLKSSSHHSDLDISKVKGSNTKMGRTIVKQEEKLKSMENLKRMFGKKIKNNLKN